jgi:hypothetical protein
MRKSIFILLMATLSAGAQDQIEWVTPFATVEFKEDNVHYYYVDAPAPLFLYPMFLPPKILLPIKAFSQQYNHEDITFWKPIIREQADGNNFMGLSRDEKNQFLKAFTLQSIWAINQRDEMPSQDAWLLVVRLSDDKDTEIAHNAKLASELYVLIKRGIEDMNKMWNKQH